MTTTAPAGTEQTVSIISVRPGEWMHHPHTGAWVQVSGSGPSSVRTAFGPEATWLIDVAQSQSIEVPADATVTVRRGYAG